MTDNTVEATTDDVTSAIERLLYGQQAPAPEAEAEETQAAPEPQPRPQPVQETDDEDEAPVDPDNAEVEGAVLQTVSEPDKAVVAESPKAPEAPKTLPVADTTQQDQLLAQLNQLVPQLQAIGAAKFSDIKTPQDLWALAQSGDPEKIQRYNDYVIYQGQLQHAQNQQRELAMEAQKRWYAAEAVKLVGALPEIADEVKGPQLKTELRKYALAQGYTEQQISMASAHDVVTLHKAMQFEKWQAGQKAEAAKVAAEQAKAKEKAAKAPPVSRPGVATDEKRSKAQERLQQFQKSGKTEDLAVLLQEAGLA